MAANKSITDNNYPPVGASLSNRRTVAMVVNDDTGHLTPRGALASFASMLAPTGAGFKTRTASKRTMSCKPNS
ncbi:hypothetical protein DM828_20150 [Pseudomonas umsongensis]|nr:hypothetical protein [Pseudomonas umsongensis]